MIIHTVRIGRPGQPPAVHQGHRRIYVGAALADTRYRDLLVTFRHRWEFYTRPTIEFFTHDWDMDRAPSSHYWTPEEEGPHVQACTALLTRAHGAMFIVTRNSCEDAALVWEMAAAQSRGLAMAGVAVGRGLEGRIPDPLKDRMIRYGWEWFAQFINGL